MAKKALPSVERLRQLFEYDLSSGILIWKERSNEFQGAASWNKRCAGKLALTSKDGGGYPQGSVDGSMIKAHQVIWKLATGNDPDMIDHVNGVRSDNRISNLRSVTFEQNCQNRKKPCSGNNTRIGVSYNKKKFRFYAYISSKGKNVRLGSFVNIEDAIAVREKAERELGYHPNHGRMSNDQE